MTELSKQVRRRLRALAGLAYERELNRELFVFYDGRDYEWKVARAVVNGLLSKEEVGNELVSVLEPRISFLREQR